ncbi:42426_t:CDS:2, partial [Gigaspora margarita]
MECLVREINPELEILPLHNQLKAIPLQESPPTNAGYYYYQPTNKKDECKKLDYDPNNYQSLPTLLGFIDAKNVALLRAAVSKHYPNIFLNQQKLINATKTEELLHANLKRKADQISNDFEHKESCELEKTNINKEDLLELNIKNAIKSAKLGSAILISIEQYLLLILMQSCHNCNNKSFIDKVLNVISIGFQFTKAVAASGLAAGISYNAVQSLLAIIGITNQISSRTYHHYQKMYFSSFRNCATSSTKNALKKYIEHT